MKRSPMISIIISVYNCEKYVKKCLESIFSQTCQDYEIILLNDGSTDGSLGILEEIQTEQKDIAIRLVNKENTGLGDSRNIGITMAAGEDITFLDSDDYWDRDFLEKMLKIAEKNKSDIVLSGNRKIDPQGRLLDVIKYQEEGIKRGTIVRFSAWAKLYRREYILKHHMKFANTEYEDNSFSIRAIFLTDKIEITDYVGYNNLKMVGTITAKPVRNSCLPYREIRKSVEENQKERELIHHYSVYELNIISFLMHFIFHILKGNPYVRGCRQKPDKETLLCFTDFSVDIINKYFRNSIHNKYLKLFADSDLKLWQKLAAKLFLILCRINCAGHLVRVYYFLNFSLLGRLYYELLKRPKKGRNTK